MIGNFSDVREMPKGKFAESSLGKKADSGVLGIMEDMADKPVDVIEDNRKNCPIEHGEWSGERGNSKWEPEKGHIPQKSNPEQKSWEEILESYDIDGVDFKKGEPDFSPISKGDVTIKEFSPDRSDNFDKADMELAKKYGCSPGEVRIWRKENKYTWHECKDKATMQKVPSIVHNNVTHRGGISEAKKGA